MGTSRVRETYFYEVLADRVSVDDGLDESALDRGQRLEVEAIEAFEQAYGKVVDQVGFAESESNEFMGLSPDGLIMNDGKYTEAVEAKCLSSANHVRAWVENEIPEEYYAQVVQYFIVNEDLEKLYFILYDPRVTVHPLHVIEVNRQNIQEDLEEYKQKEIEFLESVNQKIEEIIKV